MSAERFDGYVERALYHPVRGFYAAGGQAGRRGDFLTSPEVGPLFGAVLARALDTWWHELGDPDPFTVVEAGAGPGTLARTVALAAPECAAALHYVTVERSAAQRAQHPGGIEALPELPDGPVTGVMLANELLDNLPFRLLERTADGWAEIWVEGGVEALVRLDDVDVPEGATAHDEVPMGARIPVQEQAATWLREALALVERGRVVVVDYADSTPSMAARPHQEWLRTYRSHGRGGDPLDSPGSQDITVEVAVDQLAAVRPPDHDRSQAEFLAAHGLDELVDEGRRLWEERAHLGDLAAIRARSRATEADALTDPAGLGAFRVLEWMVG
ncbi:MAG: SAM-dependent methyltransferase [Acidimicrobiales bacterium]|nr:SAM-dependent methyltransferase [Acidimicrobiales bacterium]